MGWLFYLYDNEKRLPKDDSKRGQIKLYVGMDVPVYVEELLHGARDSVFRAEMEGNVFKHLKPDENDKKSPWIWWPLVGDFRRRPDYYHQACRSYLDKTTSVDRPNGYVSAADNKFNPLRVFTRKNALKRMRRICGDSIDMSVYQQIPAEITALDMGVAMSTPARPIEAYLIPLDLCIPHKMRGTIRPPAPRKFDRNSEAFRAFAELEENKGRTEKQIRLRFKLYIGNAQDKTAQMDLETYFQTHRALMANLTLAQRKDVVQEAYRQWPKVWNEMMKEGVAYDAMLRYHVQRERQGLHNFCMGFTPVDENVDVAGNIHLQHLRALDDLKDVATAHVIIVLIKLAAFHGASYYPVSNSKNLTAGVFLAGTQSKSKTFAFMVALALCVEGSVLNLAYETDKATMSSGNQRGLARYFDEGAMNLLGVDKACRDTKDVIWFQMNGASGTAATHAELHARRTATSKNYTVDTAFIGEGGKRDVARETIHAYGTTNLSTNACVSEISAPSLSRRFGVTPRENQLVQFDALDRTTGEGSLVASAAKSKNWNALCAWNHRCHYIGTLCHIMMAAKVLPYMDTTLHDRLYNSVTHHLNRQGLPGGREVRPWEKTTQLAVQMTLERIITLVFDMGIGGPDPSRPFRISDLEYFVPFLFIPECVTVLALEVAPVHIDPVMIEIFKAIKSMCEWTSDDRRSPMAPDYYADQTVLARHLGANGNNGKKSADSATADAINALAKELMNYGCPYSVKVIAGTLAVLLRPLVPVEGGKVENGLVIDHETNEIRFHYKLIENFADEHVIWNALCTAAGWAPDRAPLFVRGLTKVDDPSTAYKSRFCDQSKDFKDTEQVKLDKSYEKQMERYKKDVAFPDLKQDIVKARQLRDNNAGNEAVRADYQKTVDRLERDLRLRTALYKQPTKKKASDPRQIRNPNYKKSAETIAAEAEYDWGGLGDTDCREVRRARARDNDKEFISITDDDEVNMVKAYLRETGLVTSDEAFDKHYANPRNLSVLCKAYYRYRRACVNVYDVVRRIHIQEVREALNENRAVDARGARFVHDALETRHDKDMWDAKTDTDEEKEMVVEDRLQSKLERMLRALAQAVCDRWRVYQQHDAIREDLHSKWVYADLMNNYFRKLVLERSWTEAAVKELAEAIYHVWTQQEQEPQAALNESEFHRLAVERVTGVAVAAVPQPMDCDDDDDEEDEKEDEEEDDDDDDDMEIEVAVQNVTNLRQQRDELEQEAVDDAQKRRKPRRAKRMRTVDDFDAIPPESGPISDSSADEKEESEPMVTKKTRFDFVRKPIQQQQRRPSSMNDEEEEEEEVISDNGATRDCIVQPMVH